LYSLICFKLLEAENGRRQAEKNELKRREEEERKQRYGGHVVESTKPSKDSHKIYEKRKRDRSISPELNSDRYSPTRDYYSSRSSRRSYRYDSRSPSPDPDYRKRLHRRRR